VNILALTNLYPNPIQPHLAPWNRAQLSALAERHAVRVISPVLWTEEWAARRRSGVRIPASRRASCGSIAVEYPRYYYPPGILRNCYGECFRLSAARAFQRALREQRPDVVYTSWAYPDGWAAVELASKAKLPVVIRVLGSDVLSLADHPGRQRKTIEALKRANKVIAVSRHLASATEELGVPRENIEVVYNGLDREFFCPGSRDDARERLGISSAMPTILFVGNLVPVKQVETLIDACRILRDNGIPFHCHLLGDGPLRASLTTMIEGLSLQGQITLHGQKRHEELVHWYRASNVVVLPSRSEGIPNVLLEAAACGTPFVASRVGGIPEIEAHPKSRLVEPGNIDAFAEEIANLLAQDCMLADPLPIPAPSWEQSALDLEAVLLDVISERDARPAHPLESAIV
jgi:glycosyltransferase involved in cell wall biosynthesis